MKKIAAGAVLCLLACGTPWLASAQVPLPIHYQGHLTDATGVPVNAPTSITFRLYDAPDAPNALWAEMHVGVPVANGHFSVMLGSQQPLAMPLFDNARWLGVQAAANAEMTPRQQLAAAPFALRAHSLSSAATIQGSQIIGTIGNASVPGAAPWAVVSASSQQTVPNSAYVVTAATRATITLPASAAVGDVVKVSSPGAGGFTLVPGPGQRLAGINNPAKHWTKRGDKKFWESVATSADGTKFVAVASLDRIYTSTDSGLTWTPREAVRGWSAVASSADGTKLLAAESGGPLYTSADSGATWTPRDVTGEWVAVASSADGTKLVAVENPGGFVDVENLFGLMYTSSDGGATWTPRESPRNWSGVASSADGTKLVASAAHDFGRNASGEVHTSADSGVTWTARDLSLDPVRDWRSVATSADGTVLVAVSFRGLPWTSRDAGVTWQQPTALGMLRGWGAVASSADGNKLVAVTQKNDLSTENDYIFTSDDGGATWAAGDAARDWRSVASSADGNTLVATSRETLLPFVERGGWIYTSGRNTISGAQFSALELVYGGSGVWMVVNQQGSLTTP